MPNRYSIAEARRCLPDIVDQAEGGIDVTLSRRGIPVAVVVGVRVLERLRAERPSFGTAYRDFLTRHGEDVARLDVDIFSEAREKGDGRAVTL